MTPGWNEPSHRYPNGQLTWTLPYEDDDLPGVSGDKAEITFDPNAAEDQRWTGMICLDQCDHHDCTDREILLLRVEYGIQLP